MITNHRQQETTTREQGRIVSVLTCGTIRLDARPTRGELRALIELTCVPLRSGLKRVSLAHRLNEAGDQFSYEVIDEAGGMMAPPDGQLAGVPA
jgi:hypothetical protein